MGTKRTAVRCEVITLEHVGRRIDNYLASRLKHMPKSLIYKLLRSGQVRVNGGRVKPDYRLVAADEVRIPPLDDSVEGIVVIPPARLVQLAQAILLETEDFLVVNKPAGLACHAGSGLRYGVIEIARALRPQVPRLDLAHRLDRDTSGCLVLSKHVVALRSFHAELRERRLQKRYLALLRGTLPPELVHITAALEVEREDEGERRATVADEGKASETVIEHCRRCGPHSLVQLRLVTGRMHQIRAHARHIGHPVAGDRHYGDDAFNQELAALGLSRLFLHAAHIEFTACKQVFDISAELPAELQHLLDALAACPT
jgi:23S rRNA pseudouridine955/2504/2580 synthase